MKLHARTYPQLFEFSYVVFRVGWGLAMLTHGYPKLIKLLDGGAIKFADPFGLGAMPSLVLAVFAEVVCAVLVSIGLLTRVAVLPLMVTMAVAAFIVHGDDPFGKKEMAILYLLGYLLIFAKGAGKLSMDRALGRG